MHFVFRWTERVIIFIISLSVIWLIVTQVFNRLDQRLSLFTALFLTYLISAYVLLPQIIHLTTLMLRKGRIPRFTRAADGLPADLANLILMGTEEGLRRAFEKAGWHEAEALTIKTGWKMIVHFVRNTPYPSAPFSSLYLFGRKQDIGFQLPISNSPRQRHHVRFWATNTDRLVDPFDIAYWTKKQPVDYSKPVMWIGAATRDTGFGLAKLTYQITHRTDPDVDEERDYVLATLESTGAEHADLYESGQFKVGRYSSDGKIAVMNLPEIFKQGDDNNAH